MGQITGATTTPLMSQSHENVSSSYSFYSIILVIILTSCWYFSSSKNAIATQQLINGLEELEKIGAGHMAVLTSLQILSGLFLSVFFSFIIRCGNECLSVFAKKETWNLSLACVGLLHFIGCFFTNSGFSYGSAVLVQIVKVLEPIETLIFMALMNVMWFHRHHGVTWEKLLGTLFVVTGALMLLLQKGIDAKTNMVAVEYAILSGICMAMRNVISKSKAPSGSVAKPNGWREILSAGLSKIVLLNTIASIPSIITILLAQNSFAIIMSIYNSVGGIQAVWFHGLYNIASVSVLSITSAQTHSLLNVGKRISNIISAILFFQLQIGRDVSIGLVIVSFGGFIYSGAIKKTKFHLGNYTQKWFKMAIFIVTLFSLLSTPTQLNKYIDNGHENIKLEKTKHKMELKKDGPKRSVVLLGPHDRYNFGDLLFEKVLSKLLQTELGYHDDEIVRGGIVSTNMSSHGGPVKIFSMKEVQRMSQSSLNGPFDIIYTGGEALGCYHECGVHMLPTTTLKYSARADKVYGCAYLFPKDLLLPSKGNHKNIAIVNSMGGFSNANPDCRRAVDTADYKAFRDTSPLAPDSAVITKELYGDLILSYLEEVKSSLFLEEDKDKKYVAVQFRNEFSNDDVSSLAKELDTIARNTQCIIVFVAAGTAPNHDSFAYYKTVLSAMNERGIVYEEEHVWKVVALISGSEAVLSTSLHIRVMAFIYFKPRVTWCSSDKGKHKIFVELWDAADVNTCVTVGKSWNVLSKYVGDNAQISQNMTKVVYKETVQKYMDNFYKWAKILNATNQVFPVD